jgi:acyl-CoA thioesterase I
MEFRMKFLISALILFFVQTTHAKKLVILGDSLTEGYGVAKEQAYPYLLQQKLSKAGKADWTVVNSGVSGSTSASGPQRIKWLIKSKPDIIILALGANDGLRGLEPSEMKKNLAQTVDLAKSENIKVIIAGMKMPPNYGKDYTLKFEKVFGEVAKEKGILLIPFLLQKVAGVPGLNQGDGIHPNEEGHKIITETVYSVVKDIL